jgi:hypothetical protein
LFQAIKWFNPTYSDLYKASKMICKVRRPKSRIKTCSILENIITSSNNVFKFYESGMAVEIRKLGNLTRETAKINVIPKQTAGSSISILELQAKKSDLTDTACIFVKLYSRT